MKTSIYCSALICALFGPSTVFARHPEAYENYQLGETKVIDNYLEEATLKFLSNPKRWKACEGGGWINKDDEPDSIWDAISMVMWEDHPALKNLTFAGYEYWCNWHDATNPKLGWHLDKDEAGYQDSDEWSFPYLGAVLYGFPHENFEGGLLEILPKTDPLALANHEEAEQFASMHRNDTSGLLQQIKPQYNRLVTLNVTHWHRVSPVSGAGRRHAFSVNVWKEKPRFRPAVQEKQCTPKINPEINQKISPDRYGFLPSTN